MIDFMGSRDRVVVAVTFMANKMLLTTFPSSGGGDCVYRATVVALKALSALRSVFIVVVVMEFAKNLMLFPVSKHP